MRVAQTGGDVKLEVPAVLHNVITQTNVLQVILYTNRVMIQGPLCCQNIQHFFTFSLSTSDLHVNKKTQVQHNN